MTDFLERLRERRVVRWALAYVAGAWVAIEVVSQLGQIFPVPLGFQRASLSGFGASLRLGLTSCPALRSLLCCARFGGLLSGALLHPPQAVSLCLLGRRRADSFSPDLCDNGRIDL